MALRKPTQADQAAQGSPKALLETPWCKRLPALSEYLCSDSWDDDSPRELSTLTLKVQDGGFLAVMNDLALRRSCYYWGGTVEDALKALEKALGGTGADWRAWSHKGKKK